MAGEYERAITIKEAIHFINEGEFLLPAIQRKFVWSSHQICVLFDSIMRGYPINSFMMWEVKSNEIKNEYRFYDFLTYFCQRFNEDNPIRPTNASYKDFKAIIDGQQRLTSLYIGLCGTYAYKQPRVWWPSTRDDSILPPRKLYIDLAQCMASDDDESLMMYNFKFLTQNQYNNSHLSLDSRYHWFPLEEILRMPQVDGGSNIWNKVVRPYLEIHDLLDNVFSQETLGRLYDVIRNQRIIHYFNENSQEIDHVLDVFLRTNSGGTKLDFSDLLMSIAVAHWDGDFRKELDDLTRQIHHGIDMGFYIERDWVLKTCLVLTGDDVRFKVKNFHSEQVKKIQSEWTEIKSCILESLRLIRRFGINPQSLTSKNAVIPVCFYLYNKTYKQEPLYKSINNLSRHLEQRETISKWFYMVLLKGVFGGQADAILRSMREVLSKHMSQDIFPLEKIVDRFKGTNKDLRFNDEYVENLLDTQYGEGRCRVLLHLLFPEMNPTEVFHIDHLHPKSMFESKISLKKLPFLSNDQAKFDFFADQKNWNSIANLHLLNHSQNLSKNSRPLKDWLASSNVSLSEDSLLVKGVDLSFEAFPEFYAKRRVALKMRLMERVFLAEQMSHDQVMSYEDNEVVDE